MVEVFKTNVPDGGIAKKLLIFLTSQMPKCKINFDLEDCDRILRVESATDVSSEVKKVMEDKGFTCEELPE